MFFVVSPEKPKPAAPYMDPVFFEGAQKTRKLMDAAIAQGKISFEDPGDYALKVSGMDPRSMDLVQKLALYFCVDDINRPGPDKPLEIEEDHVERAVALVNYRNQAARFLAPIEADGPEGRLQKEIIRELRQNRGKMKYRDLCRNLDYARYGLYVWQRSYKAMLSEGIVGEWSERQPSGQNAQMTGLLKLDD